MSPNANRVLLYVEILVGRFLSSLFMHLISYLLEGRGLEMKISHQISCKLLQNSPLILGFSIHFVATLKREQGACKLEDR